MSNRISKIEWGSRPQNSTQHVGWEKKQLAVNWGSIWHGMGVATGVISSAKRRQKQDKSISDIYHRHQWNERLTSRWKKTNCCKDSESSYVRLVMLHQHAKWWWKGEGRRGGGGGRKTNIRGGTSIPELCSSRSPMLLSPRLGVVELLPWRRGSECWCASAIWIWRWQPSANSTGWSRE